MSKVRAKEMGEGEEGRKEEQWVLRSVLNWFLQLVLISRAGPKSHSIFTKVTNSEKSEGLGDKKSTVLES